MWTFIDASAPQKGEAGMHACKLNGNEKAPSHDAGSESDLLPFLIPILDLYEAFGRISKVTIC